MQRLHCSRVFVSSSALLALASAAALADDLRVPRDHRTVEEALATASAGDRVIVKGGTFENIHVRRGDVQIVARGTTVKGYVWIDASNVSVSGLRLGPNARVVITGDDVTLSGVRATGRGRRAISVQGGNRATITRNKLSNGDIEVLFGDDATIADNKLGGGAISATTDGARIESNVVGYIAVEGDDAELVGNACSELSVQGDDCDVSGNRITNFLQVQGDTATVQANQSLTPNNSIWVSGNSALVLDNDVLRNGIVVNGDDAVVVGNDLTNTHFGIDLSGERFTIAQNEIDVAGFPERAHGLPTNNPAIRTVSQADPATDGGAILENDIEHFASPGIEVSGNAVLLSGNDLHGVAAGTSIQVQGDANVIQGNVIAHSEAHDGLGDGVAVIGDSNVVEENAIDGVPLDAILVWSGAGNVVSANDIDAVPGCGIVVTCGAFTTTVIDCNVTGCNFGLVNEGFDTSMTSTSTLSNMVTDILDISDGFETFTDNTFTTISHDRVIAPVTSLTTPPTFGAVTGID